jgi:hypothetical protein
MKTPITTAMFIRYILRWIGIPRKSKDGEIENKENKYEQSQVEVLGESIEQSVQLVKNLDNWVLLTKGSHSVGP